MQPGQAVGQRAQQNILARLHLRRRHVVPPASIGQVGQLVEVDRAVTVEVVLLAQVIAENVAHQVHVEHLEDARGHAVAPLLIVPAAQQFQRLLHLGVVGGQAGQQRHVALGAHGVAVEVDAGEIVGVDGAVGDGRVDHVGDALAAVAAGPVAGDEVGVVLIDDGVVGGDDIARRWVKEGRQFLVGDRAVPLVFVRPARHGHHALPVAADGHDAGHLIGDVAVYVGVDEVLRWDVPVAQGLAELIDVLGLVDQQRRLQDARWGSGGRPAHGQDVGLVFEHVADDRPVLGLAHGQGDILAAVDLDDLLDEGHVAPLAHVLVLVGVVGVDLLDVEVLHVGADVGDAPGDAVVVADDDAGDAGEAETGHIPAGRVQADLVPDRRHLDAQVRIVGQQGQAGGGVLAGDDPVVAAQEGAVAQRRRRLANELRGDLRPIDRGNGRRRAAGRVRGRDEQARRGDDRAGVIGVAGHEFVGGLLADGGIEAGAG